MADLPHINPGDPVASAPINDVIDALNGRVVGIADQTANIASNGEFQDIPGCALTFQRKANTAYLLMFGGTVVGSANAIGYVALTNAAGTMITDSGALYIANAAFGARANGYTTNVGAAGEISIKLRTQRLAGTGALTAQAHRLFIVELGPTA
jgi:hypothetical protein